MLPPIENDLVEADFNEAVTTKLYLFERGRDVADARVHAQMVGIYVRGGTLDVDGGSESQFFTAEAEEYLNQTAGNPLGD